MRPKLSGPFSSGSGQDNGARALVEPAARVLSSFRHQKGWRTVKQDGITRRDFLNGARLAIGASLALPCAELLASEQGLGADYYPPAKTGLRGTHDGAWETMHARVQGQTWPVGKPEETYDLVIAGGGISGLAAGCAWR